MYGTFLSSARTAGSNTVNDVGRGVRPYGGCASGFQRLRASGELVGELEDPVVADQCPENVDAGPGDPDAQGRGQAR